MSLSVATATFFDSRLLRLAQLVRRSFVRLESDTPADQVLGWGLVTDADAQHLVPAIYRRHDHDDNVAQAHLRYDQTGVDWDLYLRWTPVEWPRSTSTAPTAAEPELDEVWQQLLDRRSVSNGVDRTYWPSVMVELAANSMVVLQRSGWFDDYPHSVRMLQVVDGAIPTSTRRRWVQQMNSEASMQSYLVHDQQFMVGQR